ncbi:MAG: hypothetical protein JRG71_13385 [Deltaproteobacteria bacterium]|nr:hypothetical protein [Deltaproteobacteria bacterium]
MRKPLLLFIVILISFTTPAYADKVSIAIGSIEYRAKDSSENKVYTAFGKGVREDTRAFVDMLTTALVKTRKFDVIERDRMAEILKEQGMSLEGIATGGYQGDNFNLQGVDYIITGSITEYGETAKTMEVVGFKSSKRIATMAVDIRILNVETGSIEIAESVRAEKKGGNSLNVQGFASGGDSSSGALMGAVMRETSSNVANLIVSSIYPVKVVALTKGDYEVMLNYGSGYLKKGDMLQIFSQGEVFVDPDTGEELGSEEELVGKVTVYNTQAKFSKAKVMSGQNGIAVGMLARVIAVEDMPKKKKKKKTLW